MNILDRAAKAESFSNGSSSIMNSGYCESVGKNDSCMSESSVGFEKLQSYGEESKEGSSRGNSVTENFKNKL